MVEWIDKTYINEAPYDDPHTVHLRELNAKGSIKSLPAFNPNYLRREASGFYRNFNDVDDKSPESWLARKAACTASTYIVALSCKSSNEGEFPLNSSGIVVEYEGIKRIFTSTYIFGGRSQILAQKVDIFLPNGNEVCGSVSYADTDNNIVLIHAELDDTSCASLSSEVVDVGAGVLSVGLHSKYGLMACRGTITVRADNLDSDNLMSSSCTISESGIGGPVIVQQSGVLVGINVYISKKSSSFIPSCILAHYLEYLVTNNQVLHPWLGFKARSLNEKKLVDLVALYKEFPSFKGIFVTEVTKGSPADRAGIFVDDIILSCNDIDLSSPVELADLLLKLGKSRLTCKAKGRPRVVEVVIRRTGVDTMLAIKFQDFTSPNVIKWPVVPLEQSLNECEIVLCSSQVENCEVKQSYQNTKNRTREIDFSDGLGGMNSSSNLKIRNGLSSVCHDIENVERLGIDSEISGLKMPGEPVRSTSILETQFGNGFNHQL